MRADGIFDVDANTSIDQLSKDLNIEIPEVCTFYILSDLLAFHWNIVSFLLISCSFLKFVMIDFLSMVRT